MGIFPEGQLPPVLNFLNGGPSAAVNGTGVSDPSTYAVNFANSDVGGGGRMAGSGGGELRVEDDHVEIDGGLVLGGGLTVDDLTVTDDALIGDTLTVTGTLTANGHVALGNAAADLITVNGTPTFLAASTFKHNVTIQNSALATLAFFDVTAGNQGVTLGAGVTLEPLVAADQIVKFKGSTTSGGFWLGATNVAAPALMFRDNANTLMAQVNPTGSTYALDVNFGTPATNAARFTGDVLNTGTFTATGNVAASLNVSGAKIVAGGTTFSGSEKFRVVSGTSRFEGDVTMSSGTLALSSGNIDVQSGTAGQIRVGAVIVNAASLSGTEELRVGGQSRLEGAVEITTGGMSVVGGAIIDTATINGTGTVFTFNGSSQTQGTVGGAGGASALPATPRGYLKVVVGATSRVIPYYDN